MAGRGRRVGGYSEKDGPLRRPGEAAISPANVANISVKALVDKISEISVMHIDPILLHETEILFKQLCVTGDSMKEILLTLHDKALSDSTFGEKLVIALDQVSTFEVDRVLVRSHLLSLIQNDYEVKDTLYKSDSRKFINSVSLLGDVFNGIRVHGKPVIVLGCGILDYMDLLLEGDEEQLKMLTKQIVLNGSNFSTSDSLTSRYELLKHSLRKALVKREISSKSKCWILLALDYIMNDLKPLNGVIRDFYLQNMGDEFMQIESLVKKSDPLKNSVSVMSSTNKTPNSKNETIKKQSKSDELFQDIENLSVSNPLKQAIKAHSKINKSAKGGFMSTNKRNEDTKMKESSRQGVFAKKDSEKKPPKSDDDFYGVQISGKLDSPKK